MIIGYMAQTKQPKAPAGTFSPVPSQASRGEVGRMNRGGNTTDDRNLVTNRVPITPPPPPAPKK